MFSISLFLLGSKLVFNLSYQKHLGSHQCTSIMRIVFNAASGAYLETAFIGRISMLNRFEPWDQSSD